MTGTITAKMVADLRARTGAGMMECKRALQEADGEAEKAIELLRTRGAAKADQRAARAATDGVIGSYVHFNQKIGVLVEVNCETDFVARTDDFQNLARDLALHVASAKPLAVRAEDVPEDLVATERRVYEAQAADSGKPANIQSKIVEGKLRQFFTERALLEQPFVKDDSKTVADLVKEASARLGENIVVRRFARFELGAE